MADDAIDIPSIVSHVSIGVNDLAAALTFYDAVLATVGATRKLSSRTWQWPTARRSRSSGCNAR